MTAITYQEMDGFEYKPVAVGLLHPVEDADLIKDLEKISHRTGVPTNMIVNSILPNNGATRDEDRRWLKNFDPNNPPTGTYMVKAKNDATHTKALARMQWMAGVLIRNYIEARVVSIFDIIEDMEGAHRLDQVDVVFIYNLEVGLVGKEMTGWQLAKVLDFLARRLNQYATFVYVESLENLGKFGPSLREFVEGYYVPLKPTPNQSQ